MSDDNLKTLLREQLDDVHPDLYALHAAAVRQGTRIRRVRRAGVVLGTAAAVAAVAVGASQLGAGTTEATDPGFAAAPPAPARLHVGDIVRLPGGGTAAVTEKLASRRHDRYQVVVHGNRRQVAAFKRSGDAWLRQRYPLDTLVVGVDVPAPSAKSLPPVDLPGWSCQWFTADDKGACSAADGGVFSVVWRPADEHADYLDPGKADVMPGVHTYVSPLHGDRFVTIQPGLGTTQADVDAAAEALVWRH